MAAANAKTVTNARSHPLKEKITLEAAAKIADVGWIQWNI